MRRILFALPVVFALGVVIVSWRGGAPKPSQTPMEVEAQPRYTVQDARWTRYDAQGQPSFEASAAHIDYFDDESARLETLEMRALGGAGSPWLLTAPSGYAPPHAQRMKLLGPVNATAHWPKGETTKLATTELWVDEAKRELYTDAPVHVTGPGRDADSEGMRADWTGKTFEMHGDVRMRYTPPPR